MIIAKIKKYLFENRSIKQTVIKNSFWLLTGEFVSKGFTFLTSLWVARYLGVKVFGESNFIITVVGFFVILMDFGLSTLIYREVSKDVENIKKYFVQTLFFKMILAVVVIILAGIGTGLVHQTQNYWLLIMIYLLYAIFSNVNDFVRVFLRAKEHMEHEALLKIASAIIFFLVSAVFIYFIGNLQGLFVGYLISTFIALIFSFFYIVKYLKITDRSIDLQYIKNIARMAIPFFLGGIFVYFYSDINIVLLSTFKGNEEVGLFSAAYKLIFYVYIILGILSLSIFKKLVDQSKNKEIFMHYIKKYTQVSLLISGFFVAVFWIFGGYIIHLIYGEMYTQSTIILQLLSFLIVLKSLSYVFGTGLTSISKEYTRFFIQLFVAIINLIIGYILIPIRGYMGCIVLLLSMELLLMLLYRHYLYRII